MYKDLLIFIHAQLEGEFREKRAISVCASFQVLQKIYRRHLTLNFFFSLIQSSESGSFSCAVSTK